MRRIISLLAVLCLSIGTFAQESGNQTLNRVMEANIFKKPMKITCKETTREPVMTSEFYTLGDGRHSYSLTQTGPVTQKYVGDGEFLWNESAQLLDENTYVNKTPLAIAEVKWPRSTVKNPALNYIETLRLVMTFQPAVNRTENGERVLEIAGTLSDPASLSPQSVAKTMQTNPIRALLLKPLLDIEGLHGCSIVVGESDLIPRRITYVDSRKQLTMQYLFTVTANPDAPSKLFDYEPPKGAMIVNIQERESIRKMADELPLQREREAQAAAEAEKSKAAAAKAKADEARAKAEKERKRREELEINGVR